MTTPESRWTGSSSFISTYEPVGLSEGVTRILIEGHTTHSKEVTESIGELRESTREELTLSTALVLSPMIDLEWTGVAAVLVELRYKSDSEADEVFENGESLNLSFGGLPRVARKTGPHQDRFGLWEWSFELSFVTLKLIDRSVIGKVRMSGRGCQLPRELREVELDRYWEGRSNFLDEFSAKEIE